MNEELQTAIEKLVDAHGARMVAESLVDVLWGKAQHLEVNWQERSTARVWRRLAIKLGNAVHWCNQWPS